MVSARTANGIKAEHLTGAYWLVYTDTDRRDLIKVADGYEIGSVNFEMWRVCGLTDGPDPSFVPIAHASRYYNRKAGKPEWHISDEGKFWDRSTPYVRDLKEILTIRAENHARRRGGVTMQINVRADRGTVVHAAHPSSRRPLCVPVNRRLGDPWYSISLSDVTCRRCLKKLGRELPSAKRPTAKVAVTRVLKAAGLTPRDFMVFNRMLPKSETGGLRIVDYTAVSLYGDKAAQVVIDNARQIIEALWTNKNGRHGFHLWVKERPGRGPYVVFEDDDAMVWANDPEFRRVASKYDLPDQNLMWGE